MWFVCGWQVKLCDPLVTRGPSERFRDKELIYKALYKFAFFTLLLLLHVHSRPWVRIKTLKDGVTLRRFSERCHYKSIIRRNAHFR